MSRKLDAGYVVMACMWCVCATGCDARLLAAGDVTALGTTLAMMWMTLRLKKS